MAKIYPEDLSFYILTGSEEILLDKMKQQLSDEYHIFYSIRWNDENEDSECDFLIFNQNLGFICMEVKGGKRIGVHNNSYFIELDDGERRYLKCSPHTQAEKSMRYFLKKYKETFNKSYDGIYGYAAAFPFYHFNPSIYDENATIETTINVTDLNNLKKKISEIFMFYKKKSNDERRISSDDNRNFLDIINKSISINFIKGGHNLLIRKQIDELTRSQNTLLDFINDFEKVIITGGAGTGKSFLAYAKIIRHAKQKVLFATYSESLIEKAKMQIEREIDEECMGNIYYLTFREINDFKETVDWIIIDEGQDLLKDELITLAMISSRIYFFADYYQQRVPLVEIDQVRLKLNISTPELHLSRNVRSTASIIGFLKQSFNEIHLYHKNQIQGSKPETISIESPNALSKFLNDLLRTLVYKELVDPVSITILIDEKIDSQNYKLLNSILNELNLIGKVVLMDLEKYKGLENDVIIYLNTNPNSQYSRYLAYTRAKILLYEIVFNT